MLSNAELRFIQDLKKGNIDKYDPAYSRTLKHRILKKHKRLTFEALLISEIIDELRTPKLIYYDVLNRISEFPGVSSLQATNALLAPAVIDCWLEDPMLSLRFTGLVKLAPPSELDMSMMSPSSSHAT